MKLVQLFGLRSALYLVAFALGFPTLAFAWNTTGCTGIVCGLNVEIVQSPEVFIDAGYALDTIGQDLVIENSGRVPLTAGFLEAPKSVDFTQQPAKLSYPEPGESLYLGVKYQIGEPDDSVVGELSPYNPFGPPSSGESTAGFGDAPPSIVDELQGPGFSGPIGGNIPSGQVSSSAPVAAVTEVPTTFDFSTTTRLQPNSDFYLPPLEERVSLDTGFGGSSHSPYPCNAQDMWKKVAESLFFEEGSHGSKGDTGSKGIGFEWLKPEQPRHSLVIYTSPQLVVDLD